MDSFIVIGQYHGKSMISKLIRWRTWSKISHTAALSQDLGQVYEAWHKGGMQKNPWMDQPHTPGTKVEIYRVPCTREQADLFYQFLEKHVGTPYDFKAILGFVLRIPMARLDQMFCSELIFTACLGAMISLLDRIEPHKVSPGHVNISPVLQYHSTNFTP